VSDAVAKIPAPKDGEPGRDGKDGRDGVDGKDADPALVERVVSDAVAKIPAPKDGEPGRDGKDGERGESGRDGRDASDLSILKGMVPSLVAEQLSAALANLDFTSPDGGRTLHVRLAFGDVLVERSIKTDLVIDCGVWRDGAYVKGDGVTCNGSFWIAQRDTATKPETIEGRDDWRLAVKRGRDGRNGKDGDRGLKGDKGDRGEPGPRGYV